MQNMKILLLFISVSILTNIYGQYGTQIEVFEELSEVTIDTIEKVDEWYIYSTYYPSGRKQDEVRYFISNDCFKFEKCRIKYQHQIYYDNEESTIALKEGKYMKLNDGKVTYRHYSWWYTKEAKLYRKVKEKTSKNL